MKKKPFLFILLISILLLAGFPASAAKKRVAVMDFRNLTGERGIDWLSIGIAETLTHKLKEIGELEIVEQSEIKKVLEHLRMRMEIGLYEKVVRILNVDLLVVGAFQISGDEIRITARLVEVETGKILKSTMVTGSLSDIFKLQDQLTFATADTLEIRVKTKEKQRIMRRPTDKLGAYKWFSKGCGYDDHVATYDQALLSYQKALKIDPEYADAYNNLGVLYYKKGRYGEAIEELKKAIEITPDYPGAQFLEKSISELEGEVEKRPDDIRAHWELAFRYQKRGYQGLATLEFKEVIRINPRIAEAHYQLGTYYLSIGREEEAITEYEEALALKSKKEKKIEDTLFTLYRNRGITYYQQDEYQKALELLKKALEIREEKEIEELIVKAQRELGRYKRRPADASSCLKYGITYYKYGQYPFAIEELKRAIGLDSKLVDAHTCLGLAYMEVKEDQKAMYEFREAIRLDPNSSQAHLGLGNWYYLHGFYDEAMIELKKAIELDPLCEDAYYILALVYKEEGIQERMVKTLARQYLEEGEGDYRQGLANTAYLKAERALSLADKDSQIASQARSIMDRTKGARAGKIAEEKRRRERYLGRLAERRTR